MTAIIISEAMRLSREVETLTSILIKDLKKNYVGLEFDRNMLKLQVRLSLLENNVSQLEKRNLKTSFVENLRTFHRINTNLWIKLRETQAHVRSIVEQRLD